MPEGIARPLPLYVVAGTHTLCRRIHGDPRTMERHELHGLMRGDFERPAADLVARLALHDAAKVADAMAGYGVAHHDIKPLRAEMRLCGPALTILTRPGDAL